MSSSKSLSNSLSNPLALSFVSSNAVYSAELSYHYHISYCYSLLEVFRVQLLQKQRFRK